MHAKAPEHTELKCLKSFLELAISFKTVNAVLLGA